MKLIGLDVGTKRIGVSRADSSVKIAIKLGTVEVDGTEFEKIKKISRLYNAENFLIGLPRNSSGEETAQSQYSREFAKQLKEELPNSKVRFQDESLTSVMAEEHLKNRKGNFAKGDIDAEAATLILQDFLESYHESEEKFENIVEEKDETNIINKEVKKVVKKKMENEKKKKKPIILTILLVFFAAGIFGAIMVFIYNGSLTAVIPDINCDETPNHEACVSTSIIVEEGMTVSDIANTLKEHELIQNQFTFGIFSKINGYSDSYKAGKYSFNKAMSVQKIAQKMIDGDTDEEVFRLTTIPGNTLTDFKQLLFSNGYSEQEINDALLKKYDFPFLESKPEDASLEGYIYGETIEFIADASVESIIEAFLGEFQKAVDENNLIEKFAAHNLTLHQGVILASVVQRESTADAMKEVASVFYNRIAAGMTLGSDASASYAADVLDPNRETYIDNGAILAIDSCYNTRVNVGLPCGAISNPGLTALLAAAEPADTPYLYFLTGDDGLMYYGTTDSEHQQNIVQYCQEYCNVQL